MSDNSLVLWDEETQLAEIKQIYAPTLTPTEFKAFVGIGKSTGLNPFLKEIWAVKYGNGAASIFIGRDGYRKSAQANPDYDWHFVDSIYAKDSFKVVNGQPEHDYNLSDRGALVGAYALCMRKKSSRPNYLRVDLKEYSTGQSLWKTKPETMIKKVAEAQVLRMTFQEMFGNTYDESEEFDNSSGRTLPETTTTSDLTKRISGKTEEIDPVIDIIDELTDNPVTYISEEQSSKITNLFTQLGYDPAMIIEKTESLERQLKKPYDQFTTEEAESIIANMTKAVYKKIDEEKAKEPIKTQSGTNEEPKEEKKSAVGAMGEKAKKEQEAIQNSEEFKKTFPEETPATIEDVSEVFDAPAEVKEEVSDDELANATEEELRAMRVKAKEDFSVAVKKYKEDGSNVNLAERTRTSNICSKINQTLISRGYDI